LPRAKQDEAECRIVCADVQQFLSSAARFAHRFRKPTGCSRREFGSAKKNFGAERAAQFTMAYEITMKRRSACCQTARKRSLFALTALLADVQSPLPQQ